MTPNDDYYPLQLHYPAIGLPDAWDLTTGSSDVIVAVIDSGVVLEHPDVLRARATLRSDPGLGNHVQMTVSLRPGVDIDPQVLLDLCRENLSRHKCPNKVTVVRPFAGYSHAAA